MRIKTIIFALFISFSISAQNFNYYEHWKTIDSLKKIGQLKSLEKNLTKIYKQASIEDSTSHEIKALLMLSNITCQTGDITEIDPLRDVFNNFRNKVDSSQGIKKSLYQYYLAEMYNNYSYQSRWNRSNISETNIEINDDYNTWTQLKYREEIIKLYKSSLSNDSLKTEKTKKWLEIIWSEDDIYGLYPTLYDMIAKDYIKYLGGNYNGKEDERINNQIEQYEKLIALHVNDTNRTSYLNYRMQYILLTNNSVEDKKISLRKFINENPNNPFTSAIILKLASYVSPLEAHQLYEKAEKTLPDSKWRTDCYNMRVILERCNVNLTLEKYIYPNDNIPLQIEHTNENNITLKIYDVTPKFWGKSDHIMSDLDFSNRTYDENNILAKKIDISKSKPIRTYNIQLKEFKDFEKHTTVYKLDGLPKGIYKIVYEPKNKTKSNTNIELVIQVRQSLVISRKGMKLQLLDANTGKVIPNTNILLFNISGYNDKVNGHVYLASYKGSKTSDSLGIISSGIDDGSFLYIPSLNEFQYYKKSTEIDDKQHHKNYGAGEEDHYFLDRSIYRPGQTVHFKIILTGQNSEGKTILRTRIPITVALFDPNGVKKAELKLISNDYGSAFGSFLLPNVKFTGEYRISKISEKDDYSYGKGFQVEEYKRPTFQVEFDNLNGKYKLDENINIKGYSKSFSGVPISGAKLKYSIKRNKSYCWIPWGKTIEAYSQSDIIDWGELTLDEYGKFEFSFVAKSYEKRKLNQPRSYNYTVNVSVTDLNGETHEDSQVIFIGDLPRRLEINNLNTNEKSISISSTNLNGFPDLSRGVLKITKLKAPKRILTPNKKFISTDYDIFDYSTFVKYFPHLEYNNESNIEKFSKELIFQSEFEVEGTASIAINKSIPAGHYLVEAYSLFDQDTISTYKLINVLDSNNQINDSSNYFGVTLDKKLYTVGDTAILTISTDDNLGYANIIVERHATLQSLKQVELINGKAQLFFIIDYNDLDNGIYVQTDFVKWNDYSKQITIIPIVEKANAIPLKIETKVFRDKINPGMKEKWTFLVSGDSTRKETAEVLANLYDKSLDEFSRNDFQFNINNNYSSSRFIFNDYYNSYPYGINYIESKNLIFDIKDSKYIDPKYNKIPFFNWFEFSPVCYQVMYKKGLLLKSSVQEYNEIAPEISNVQLRDQASSKLSSTPKESTKLDALINIRKNLTETAFFYPNIYTNDSGLIEISFISPEALTKWKLMLFAHTKSLNFASLTLTTQTQKDLMITPNAPRFLRAGDTIQLSAKINNLATKSISGTAKLLIRDPATESSLDSLFQNEVNERTFTVDSKLSTSTSWTLIVPQNVSTITYKVIAESGNFSDGEENTLPILPNRMIVTETLPLNIRENETKVFKLDKLINSKSKTLKNFSLSMDLTTNPLWLAIMSLPYLREYPYECSEQIFSRLYGNILSSKILDSSPKIKNVLDTWRDKRLNKSKLEQNQELKNILLEESPWLGQSKNEDEQISHLALFFEINTMKNELSETQNKLSQRQLVDGSFPWYPGGKGDPYITGYIIAGFGQLRNLLYNDESKYLDSDIKTLISKSIEYIDSYNIRDLKEDPHKSFEHYLYVRSYWLDRYPLPKSFAPYVKNLMEMYEKNYSSYNLQKQALCATILKRYGYNNGAKKIIAALKERSVESNQMGMYWKENIAGWYWNQVPVETQAKVIEAFSEITPEDVNSIEAMKVWLLKQRQTTHWSSTKSTTEAVYAIMNFGKSWLNSEDSINISLGNKSLSSLPTSEGEKDLQISGYIKRVWKGYDIKPEMGKVKISKTSPGIALGGLYWQYYEDLDKIIKTNTNIKLDKQLFIKTVNNNGNLLTEIKDTDEIHIGDLITIRLIIKTDRDMDYIHIKDLRASGFEPLNVLSQYKWQNQVGYYESTHDAATNFFFSHMNKGTYVFEYDVRANNAGSFSNGITSIQNMYAPEMSAHSAGLQVIIK